MITQEKDASVYSKLTSIGNGGDLSWNMFMPLKALMIQGVRISWSNGLY
jgi:hypothetical protein